VSYSCSRSGGDIEKLVLLFTGIWMSEVLAAIFFVLGG